MQTKRPEAPHSATGIEIHKKGDLTAIHKHLANYNQNRVQLEDRSVSLIICMSFLKSIFKILSFALRERLRTHKVFTKYQCFYLNYR